MKERHRPFRARLDRALQKAHENGKLQWFNQAFAEHRRQNPALSYRFARIRLRNVIMRRMLKRQPLTAESLAAEIFQRQIKSNGVPVRQNELA